METKSKKTKLSRLEKVIAEILAILFWVYIVVKVFIFDLDIFLAEVYAPSFKWLIDFKLFLLLGIICVMWIIIGKKFPLLILYIAGYPFIVLFWKIPRLVFRYWSTAIIFAPLIFDVATTFRIYFISYALALIAAAIITASNYNIVLFLSMIILLILLAMHLVSSFTQAYKSTMFSKIRESLSKLKDAIAEPSFLRDLVENSPKSTAAANEADAESGYRAKLTTLYTFHSGIEFLSDKIARVMRSRKMDFYLILSWFWVVISTMLVFSFEYFALYKIDPNSFSAPFRPSYVSFLGFSFGKLTPSSISLIAPNNIYATALCYAELASSIVIGVILVFTILTAARERYREDIETIAADLHTIGVHVQDNARQLFSLAMTDIESILLNHNHVIVNWSRRLRGLPELPVQQNDSTKTNNDKGSIP